jgi:hypothetical protein
MVPLTYALQFRGRASGPLSRGTVVELSAPSCVLTTNLLGDGLRGRYQLAAGGEARLRSDVRGGGDRLRTDGAISFGSGHELCFRTVETAVIEPSPDPHLRHASLISEVLGGQGQFRGAFGRIVSNILVSDTGEITDNHLGVVFVDVP